MKDILKLFRRPSQKVIPKESQERFEVVLSGSGGQGMILAGRILAEAACIFDSKKAVMTQSYGPEARGGASKAGVIISGSQINYPKVMQADILLAMTQESLDKYANNLKPQGLLIVDNTFIKDIPTHFKNIFKAPFSSLAVKLLDARIIANIIALGALACLSNVVSRESLIQAVVARVPDKALVLDRIGVDTGYKVVEDSGFKWDGAKLFTSLYT